MAKGSTKGSPDKKSKGSKKGSPDKKSGKKGSPKPVEAVVKEPEVPLKILDLHPNIPVKTTGLHWMEGPGFTVLVNRCYTKDEAQIFRDFLNLPLWDVLTLDADIDQYCRECIHGNCKDWPGKTPGLPCLTAFQQELEDHYTTELPKWDFLHVDKYIDDYDRDCCVHRGGTNLRNVDVAAIPYGPRYVNTHNIRWRPPTIVKTLPPKNLGVAYTYLRNLGLRHFYDNAVLREIQKSYMNIKRVMSVNATMIRRSFDTTKLGLVLSVVPGPYAFVLFVIKNSPAYRANIHYGDQILDVDGLPFNNRLALGRLTENKGLVINVLYTMCPFKIYFQFEILKGDSMGFQIVDGNIIYVQEESPAFRARLPVNHQIIELENECIVGLTNLNLQREIRNRASSRPSRVVQMTLIPRFLYEGLIGSMDPKYIRRRALNIYPYLAKYECFY